MNLHAIELNGPPQGHVQVGVTVQVRGVDVDVMPATRKSHAKAVHGANWPTITNCRVIGGDDVQDAQRGLNLRCPTERIVHTTGPAVSRARASFGRPCGSL